MKLIKSLKNLFSRPKAEIYLVCEAFLYLLIIKYRLKKDNFNQLSKEYNLKVTKDVNDLKKTDLEQLKTISWSVERSALLLPWDGLCLVKALAAQRMLIKRNLNATLFMGVKKDSNNKELEAHAWLKYNDIFLTGRQGHKHFTIVSKFTWDIDE